MRWWLVSLVFLGLLSGCSGSRRSPSPEEATWGYPPYDALVGLTDPLDRLIEAGRVGRLSRALRAAAAAPVPPDLRPEAIVALQNDAWGVWQKVRARRESSAGMNGLARAAEALVRRLAPRAEVARWRPGRTPPAIARVLGSGWRELETELVSLAHERMNGNRRVFHVALREPDRARRALFSTLVALDAELEPYITTVPGDLEMLRFEGERLADARVFDLDRAALRRRGPEHALSELDAIRHIPGEGANDFYVDLPELTPLSELPCLECHGAGNVNSLATATLPLGERYADVLAIAERPTPPVPAGD